MQLKQIIEKDIDDRISAFDDLEKAVFTKRYNLSKKHYEILSIQSISMLYSIWEGFVQKTFSNYTMSLNLIKLKHSEVKDKIYIYNIEKEFSQLLEYPNKFPRKVSFIKKLRSFFLSEDLQLNPKINLQDNVGFNVLNNVLDAYCIDRFPEYWKNYRHPKPSLKETLDTFLRYRNGVAHGGDISSEEKVTQEVYNKYKLLLIDLMSEINIKVNDSLDNELYKNYSGQ